MTDQNKKTESEGKEQTQELTDQQLEKAAGGDTDFPAESFFNVFVEVDLPPAQSDPNRQSGELTTPDSDSEIKRQG